jgi:hypothetical protein
MPSLVIHAPHGRVQEENKRSFNETFETGIGDEYAIPSRLAALLSPGCKVILLSKDEQKRAEGELVKLEPRSKANNGMQRYDVHVRSLKMVPYKGEVLLRSGIAVV